MLRNALVFLACFSLGLVGCNDLSDVEKITRRENSLDLQGEYYGTEAIGSKIDFVLTIKNRESRANIDAVMARRSPLTEKEKEILERLKVPPARVEAIIGTTLNFRPAANAESFGGSNISENYGKTSRIRLQTDEYFIDSKTHFYFYLTGEFQKSDMSFKGELELFVTKEDEVISEKGEKKADLRSAWGSIAIAARTDAVFWTQYFGLWRGKTFVISSEDKILADLPELTLQKVNEEEFVLVPKMRTFSLRGETFTYREQKHHASALRNEERPVIEIQWGGDLGNSLILVASIWSLGQMEGTLLYETNGKSKIIGGFKLARL